MPALPKKPLAHDASAPLGVVFSGGGARGAFQVGVWEVLRNHPRGIGDLPAIVSGTSAGAINAWLMAAELTPRQMLDFWIGLGRRPPVDANEVVFKSLASAIKGVVAREPLRSLRRRRRGAKIFATLARRHHLARPTGWLALLLEFVLTARFDNLSRILDNIRSSYLFSIDRFRARLVEAVGAEHVRNDRVRIAINAVEVHTGAVARFVNHRPATHSEADARHYHYAPAISVDMVVASAAIPLLFNTVTVGELELWDGGVLVNTPLAPAVALGARRIIPVLVTARNVARPEAPLTMGEGVERLADAFLENAYNNDRKLLLERNRLAAAAPERGLAIVELFEAIRPASGRTFNAGSYLYFEPAALERMFEAGRRAARAWLALGPRRDTRPGVPY